MREPVLDIYANVDGTDLGTVTRSVEKIVARHQKDLPRGFALHPAWPERDYGTRRTPGC